MKLNFTNETDYDVKEYKAIIRKVLNTKNVLSIVPNGRKEQFFNIIFVTPEEIHRINKEYRGIDRVTDVISFALFDNEDEIVEGAEDELGDVFICIDRAIEQAAEYGHSVEREIGFLATHGYLHLRGYDHMEPEEEKEMFALQEQILAKANLKRGE